MNRAERIGKLMFRYLRNELSEQETAELRSWRNDKPAHEAFFQQQTDPDWLRQTIPAIYAGHDQGLERLLNEHAVKRSLPFRRIWGVMIWQLAASFLALIGFYALLTHELSSSNGHQPPGSQQARSTEVKGLSKAIEDIKSGFRDGQASARRAKHFSSIPELVALYDSTASPDRFHTLTTNKHGRYMITMPDGSRSWQNTGSWVAYPANFFHAETKLIVRGEVYVELTPNKSDFTPFEVQAGKISITAFTGRFNLQAYPKDSTITITAIEGVLRIKSGDTVIALQPHGQLVLSGGKTELLRDVDIAKVLGWKKK